MTDFRVSRARGEGQPPDETAWLVIEDIYDELALPYKPDPRLDELTEGQRALFVLHWVQSEVRNGGFEQLYANSTGRLAPLAPAAAELIGAGEYADVFRRANDLVPGGAVPGTAKARKEAVRGFDPRALDALESEFFDLLGATDVYDHMGRFVGERPADFFTD